MDHIFTDLSIWDIFRTQVPFLILHDAKRANDIAHSIMLIVEQGGYLPKWPLANGHTNCMIGSHADIILSDLIMKREHDSHLNMTQVLEALRIVANTEQIHDSRFDPPTYIKYGYVPFDMDEYSASLTLSYAYDDWAIGNVMYAAGLIDEVQEYTGDILCPATEIEHLIPFDYRYTEGDAWHYRFFVPHNTSRLVDLFGGAKYFAEELDTFFVRSRDWPTITIPNPYYWAGNEHNLFSVWQFHYANRSDLTQLHARWLLDNVYTVKPDGIPGNDDYGTMSTWYIFTSLGFYPLSGSSTYLIGSPAFDRITIRRNNGQCILTIIVHDNAQKNTYVERVLLNGEILSTYPFIDHINQLRCSTDSSAVQVPLNKRRSSNAIWSSVSYSVYTGCNNDQSRSHDNDNDNDDEDDYMSDKILAAAAQASGPQLLNPRRRVPPPPQPPTIPKEKTRHLIEVEQREQGLSTAITSDNKGFQLLKKMGYKEGSKLGANQVNGLSEPIKINIHPSRSGLGEVNEKKEKSRMKEEIKNKFNQQIQSTYQDNLKQRYYFKRVRIDIAKCQSVCERLDKEKLSLEENILWKNANKEKKEDDDDDEEEKEQDEDDDVVSKMETQLKKLTNYLREKHLYCVWCGETFETLDELESTCPGNERDLH
ncbi:unnamed protein product [Rotaria socialis]